MTSNPHGLCRSRFVRVASSEQSPPSSPPIYSQLIHADIQSHPTLLSNTADIIILNNVFQFFTTRPAQQTIWRFLKAETSKRCGLAVVTIPSLQEQLKEAGFGAQGFMRGWVRKERLRYDGGWFEEELGEEEEEEVKQIHLYRVI